VPFTTLYAQRPDPWLTPSLVLAGLALLFTIGSFWWIQVRRGRLRGYTSHGYTGAFAPTKHVLILPLVVHNPAPAPLVVTDLRLRIEAPRGTTRTNVAAPPMNLKWTASHRTVYPENSSREYAAPFVVDGRKAVEKFIEFQIESPATLLDDGPYDATVQALVEPERRWRRRKWRKLLTYTLNAHLAVEARANLIPRSNDPAQ
jgi:hypothetical protein